MRDLTYTYEGSKDGHTWRGTYSRTDGIIDDIEDELDKATPGTTLTFTVKVGEAR